MDRPYYSLGLKAYDLLAGRSRWEWSRGVGRAEAIERAPTLSAQGLRGGVLYHDGQFDDSRMAVALLRTFFDLGGLAMNHAPAVRLLREGETLSGLVVRDSETGEEVEVRAKVLINAAGVFADEIRRLDSPSSSPRIAPSQGAHLVLDRSFLPGETAVLVPKTSDGRVLFAIPWLGRTLVGTTDTPVSAVSAEPRALPEEVEFLSEHVGRYLGRRPDPSDVKCVFAGLRPLIRGAAGERTASLSRGHLVEAAGSGLVTITGGKWTSYRVMARDAVDLAAQVAGLPSRPCTTDRLPLHQQDGPELEFPDQVVRAIRDELARTVEDVLARRIRWLFLDARAAIQAAPQVARILAEVLGKEEAWIASQVEEFGRLASGYLLDGSNRPDPASPLGLTPGGLGLPDSPTWTTSGDG